jgi:hypothetical protein
MRAGEDRRVGMPELRRAFWLLGSGLVGLPLTGPGLAATPEAVFKLREVPVFTHSGSDFAMGQRGLCQEKPLLEVKAYPKFVSGKPVYGLVSFADHRGQPSSVTQFYFAADESRGTGKGYDRFYFDGNRDLDLRNDPVLKPLRQTPDGAGLQWGNIRQQVCFDYLSIDFDCGAAGLRTVQIMPRLLCCTYEKEEYNQVLFVRTRMYEGTVKLGSRDFGVRLGNTYLISGRLDEPGTTLELLPMEGGAAVGWWGGKSLIAAHKVDGQLFTFSASPTGDQLTVRPYQGELGNLEVGPGSRKLDKLAVRGSLRSTNLAVAVGGEMEGGWPKAARSCQIPAGDYLPSYLTIDFGRLQINVSDNYHSEGKSRDRGQRAAVYGIAVGKDKPFVMDFSNPPEVMFTSPTKGQRVRLGEELEVKAVLTDPKLDIMIRGLEDTSRKQTKTPDGRPLTYERNLSLDPTVLITRTNGERIAEGVMPFG